MVMTRRVDGISMMSLMMHHRHIHNLAVGEEEVEEEEVEEEVKQQTSLGQQWTKGKVEASS